MVVGSCPIFLAKNLLASAFGSSNPPAVTIYAAVDKLVESPGFHPGHLGVQVSSAVPICLNRQIGYSHLPLKEEFVGSIPSWGASIRWWYRGCAWVSKTQESCPSRLHRAKLTTKALVDIICAEHSNLNIRQMMELEDLADSKSAVREYVRVRPPLWRPFIV